MNKKILGSLIALNMALLAGLALVTLSPREAIAQLRGRQDYVAIAGQTRSRDSQEVIYVVDVNNYRLAALIYESANDRYREIGGYDFSRDVGR